MIAAIITVLGAGLVVAGVALLSIPAALVVAGVMLAAVGLLVDFGGAE